METIDVGDLVEYSSRFGSKRLGTVQQRMEVFPNCIQLRIRPEPIENVAGQVFERTWESVMIGKVRKVSDLELIAWAV